MVTVVFFAFNERNTDIRNFSENVFGDAINI